MKAIITAAGKGSRLKSFTAEKPKCLLDVQGKSILEYQLDALRSAQIDNIHLIKGYKQEKINFPGIRYHINDNYQNNNALLSLMYAEKEMNDDFIALYSDIIFGKHIVKKLIENTDDISAVVDTNWQEYYDGRTEHPITEAENVVFDTDGYVIEIGKHVGNDKKSLGEFIGMFKCTKKGAGIFKENFAIAKKKFFGKPFMNSKTWDKACWTDFFEFLILQGIKIKCVFIDGGWYEIDTAQDLEKAQYLLSKR